MAAAARVAHGSGRLSRPRPPRVGLRGAWAVAAAAAEGPSCLYVGPIETASQEKLEALYHQARDSYYSGQPLIVDDMFDKVELKLRLYGSKSVVKYPRCSLIRQSTYADAEGRRTNQCLWHYQASGCCCSCLAPQPSWFQVSTP
ncbi:hypothetical protein PAHAL_3G090800 [Panicum hallii]|uniref:Uncharacterized protein n=1 Tax=Panicum hallii TaxID=206008 RepID=A0A2T8KHM8_9POAL|nr:hypothetical protein PAHAL_3G090800 [Panicum hallii]